ncbi:predicted protein [Pyrenophora tritici-repentis Pt-1C-BFP]|uniref:Uncharacterized protein n=1 Tax=Pyrenophora tritici-repentis (strain Pt-1C-BFP) TaxID=426418 RepID=B2W9K0_PYRTR|nr:uncharacterized protein PTRG_06658 [Pyrenophora tritici-repentis Pt-1C-BFP]EDU49578.1 predicted protein [Pyrenophora tritici-repentis Pt-1C-BFP]
MVAIIKIFVIAALQQACALYEKLSPDDTNSSVSNNKTCAEILKPYYGHTVTHFKSGPVASDGKVTMALEDAPTITVEIAEGATPDRTVDMDLPTEAAAILQASSDKASTSLNSLRKTSSGDSKSLQGLSDQVMCHRMTNEVRIDGLERKETQNSGEIKKIAVSVENQTTVLENQAETLMTHSERLENNVKALANQEATLELHGKTIKIIGTNQVNFQGAWSKFEDALNITRGILNTHVDEIPELRKAQDTFQEHIVASCRQKEAVVNTRMRHLAAGRQAVIRKMEEKNATILSLSEDLQEERADKALVVEYLRAHTFTNAQANTVFQDAVVKAADGQMAPLLIGYMMAVNVQLGAADEATRRMPSQQPASVPAMSNGPTTVPMTPRAAAVCGLGASRYAISGAASPASIPPHLRK